MADPVLTRTGLDRNAMFLEHFSGVIGVLRGSVPVANVVQATAQAAPRARRRAISVGCLVAGMAMVIAYLTEPPEPPIAG